MPIWRNWIARLSPKEKVAGSNPAVGTMACWQSGQLRVAVTHLVLPTEVRILYTPRWWTAQATRIHHGTRSVEAATHQQGVHANPDAGSTPARCRKVLLTER